jgi:hypothetical protein
MEEKGREGKCKRNRNYVMTFYTNITLIELALRCQCPNNYMSKMNENMDKASRTS